MVHQVRVQRSEIREDDCTPTECILDTLSSRILVLVLDRLGEEHVAVGDLQERHRVVLKLQTALLSLLLPLLQTLLCGGRVIGGCGR